VCLVMMGWVSLGSKKFLQLVEHGEVLNAVHTKAWGSHLRNVTGVICQSLCITGGRALERGRRWLFDLFIATSHAYGWCGYCSHPRGESSRPSYQVQMPLTPTKCLMKESKSCAAVAFMPHRAYPP